MRTVDSFAGDVSRLRSYSGIPSGWKVECMAIDPTQDHETFPPREARFGVMALAEMSLLHLRNGLCWIGQNDVEQGIGLLELDGDSLTWTANLCS